MEIGVGNGIDFLKFDIVFGFPRIHLFQNVLEGMACVELFIRSLDEEDGIRAQYLGPLFSNVILTDENIFGIVYVSKF
jgi:hypothetical protein